MIATIITHAEHRLIAEAAAQVVRIRALPCADATDHKSIEREAGFIEAIGHLAKNKGLSLAGQVEAQKLLAASRDWVREFSREDQGHDR